MIWIEVTERIKETDDILRILRAGADLVYKEDDEASYPDIFSNGKTDEDPEQYLDTETIIRYFAVNHFLISYGRYTGRMLHNYVLYENVGRLAAKSEMQNEKDRIDASGIRIEDPGSAESLLNQ